MTDRHWRAKLRRQFHTTRADRVALAFWSVLALGALIIAHTLVRDLR